MTDNHGDVRYPRLPAQQSIRIFEAAARYLNFTKAADELALTQSGVSKQIKGLESFLGVALFAREPQKLSLTPAGRLFYQRCTQALDTLALAVSEVQGSQTQLRLQVPPTFAARWLIPRMGQLKQDYPELDLHIETTWLRKVKDKVQAQSSELITHVCKSYPYDDVFKRLLRREYLCILVSPAYLAQHGQIHSSYDLEHQVLIHTRVDGHIHWQAWAECLGHEGLDVAQGYEFETLDMALSAAENGIGLVVCDLLYAIDALATGRLVIPFNMPILLGLDYLLLSANNRPDSQSMGLYQNWLKAEIKQDELKLAQVLGDLGLDLNDQVDGFPDAIKS